MYNQECNLHSSSTSIDSVFHEEGVASSKHVRGPQLNNIMLTFTNVNTMVPLGPIVTMPVSMSDVG